MNARSSSFERRFYADAGSSGSRVGGPGGLSVAVGIATIGRATILAETLVDLSRQSRRPDRIIVCCTDPRDVAGALPQGAAVELIFSPPGLPRQRNAILDAADDCDVILFLDDDFLMEPDYVAETVAAFEARPRLAVSTGTVLADGIKGPGLTPAEGRSILVLAAEGPRPTDERLAVETFCGYGCNMAVRNALVKAHGIRVDERLPLYAWQEDVDFTRRLGVHGDVLRLTRARGVHLGVKGGRNPGIKLGYSQVANPLYLARSSGGRTYPYRYALERIWRNVASNLVRAAYPEPHVDRRGRLRGNVLALRDLVIGRMAPDRVLKL